MQPCVYSSFLYSYVLWHACGHQRTTLRSLFLPSTCWVRSLVGTTAHIQSIWLFSFWAVLLSVSHAWKRVLGLHMPPHLAFILVPKARLLPAKLSPTKNNRNTFLLKFWNTSFYYQPILCIFLASKEWWMVRPFSVKGPIPSVLWMFLFWLQTAFVLSPEERGTERGKEEGEEGCREEGEEEKESQKKESFFCNSIHQAGFCLQSRGIKACTTTPLFGLLVCFSVLFYVYVWVLLVFIFYFSRHGF